MSKKWFPCELHCHTVHSDGDFTVKDLIDTAVERHLEGIQITDHNAVSAHNEVINPPIAVLKSIEWTTFFGHMHAMDCKKSVDWRDALPDNIDEKMKAVHLGDGLVGVCHPFQLGTPICTGGRWEYHVKDWSLVNYFEVWSEGCPFMNTPNKRALNLWHDLLDKGYKITPTFGRDWHRKTRNAYHSACTYLLCDGEKLTDQKMKSAVKCGKSVISMGPLFYFNIGESTIGDEILPGEKEIEFTIDFTRMKSMGVNEKVTPKIIKLVTNGGRVLKEIKADRNKEKIIIEKNKWYNAELWGSIDEKNDCLIALTAPIYAKGENL